MIKRLLIIISLLWVVLLSHQGCVRNEGLEFDVLIINGKIIDGTGNPWFYGDIGIKGEIIVDIGDLKGMNASQVVDAKGLVVSPGFIDMHTHCEWGLGEPDANVNLNYLIQGTTTVVTGNCGIGLFKIAEMKEKLDELGLGTNAVHMIGFGTVRQEVLGVEPRNPTPEEVEKMKAIVRQGMKEGAWGMSTGLEYIPDRYATTEEVIEITKVMGEFGGVYLTHMRDEDSQVVKSTKETIRIAQETEVPVNIGHYKTLGKKNWGLLEESVRLVNEARAKGLYIVADMYPYDKASVEPIISIENNSGWAVFRLPNDLEPFAELRNKMGVENLSDTDKEMLRQQYIDELAKALEDREKREQIKRSILEGEPNIPSPIKLAGWYAYAIVYAEKNTDLIGKILGDIAEEQNRDPFDFLADLVIDEPGILHSSGVMSEEDMKYAMKEDWLMFSSDGGAFPIIKDLDISLIAHPRSFGSQARVLRKYVREEKVLTLENAVRKMTSLPAQFLKMRDRGLLKSGYKADIAIFDPKTIHDNGTYAEPLQYSTGTEYVIVNGKMSIDKGEFNGVLNGKLLLATEN